MYIANIIEEELISYGRPVKHWFLKDKDGVKYRSRIMDWNKDWAVGQDVTFLPEQLIVSTERKTGVAFIICSVQTVERRKQELFSKKQKEERAKRIEQL